MHRHYVSGVALDYDDMMLVKTAPPDVEEQPSTARMAFDRQLNRRH